MKPDRIYLPDGRALPVEVRDPTAATRQLYFTGRDQPMVARWNAERAFTQGYLASWVVARCAELIARDVSTMPFRAGADPDKMADHNPAAPLARLLGPPPGAPAPKLTARRFWWWTTIQRLIAGANAAEIELDQSGRPLYLWPLTMAAFKAVPSKSGAEWFSRFEYGKPGEEKRLTPEQTFYDWTPSPDDFRQPFSAVQAARLEVSVTVMMGRYSYAFLANGAVPTQVVITEAFPNEGERQRFRQEWNGRYQGPDNAGRTAFFEASEDGEGPLEETVVIKQVGISQKDARMIEQHREMLEHIAMAMGVPWSKLSASGRTFDNAEAEDRTYWESTVLPVAQDLADAVNVQLAPRLGSEVGWFDTSHVRVLQNRVAPTTQPVGVDVLKRAGIVSLNEARADYGLPPVDGGDERVVELPPAPPVLPAAEDEGTDDEPTRRAKPEHRDAPDHEERRARIWRSADATVKSLEGRWERAWRKLFARQQRSALNALEGKRGHKMLERRETDPQAVFNPAYWEGEARALAEDLYEAVVAQGFARLSDAFGVDFDLAAEGVEDFIASRANKLAGEVTETTYRAITDALAEGVQEGESIPKLAKRIQDVFEDASKNRATTIARTEVISAYNGSASLGASMLPEDVAAGQEWIATRDGRTRPEHAAADGQVRAVGEMFDVAGTPMAYPGDPAGDPSLTVNCRCTVAILTPDEYQAAKNEGRATVHEVRVEAAKQLLAMPFDERGWRGLLREVAA